MPEEISAVNNLPSSIAARIQENSMILSVLFTKPTKTAKASMEDVTVDADRSMLRMSKDLFDSKEFGKIVSFDSNLRQRIAKDWASPTEHLRGGLYRVANSLVETIGEAMEKAICDRQDLVDAFLFVYPSLQEDAEVRLRSLYDPKDYPEARILAQKFAISYQFASDNVPAALKAISNKMYLKEKDKAVQKLTSEIGAIEQGLTLQMAATVQKLAEATSPGADGKQRKFHASAVENMQSFCESLKARNLTGNVDLDRLADQAMEIMKGVSAQDIRDSMAVRMRVVGGITEVSTRLQELTEAAGKRRFAFGSKPVEATDQDE